MAISGISGPFGQLSQSTRQVTHVLLTRAPLYSTPRRTCFSYDLHVLSTPPAFVLSQDQTLQLNCLILISTLTRTSCYSVFKDQPGSIPKLLRNGSLPLTTVTCQDRMFLTFFLPPPGGSTTYTPHPTSMSSPKPHCDKNNPETTSAQPTLAYLSSTIRAGAQCEIPQGGFIAASFLLP